MGNPETNTTLGYDKDKQMKKKKHGKLKDEHVHHRKNGINSGAGKCWT